MSGNDHRCRTANPVCTANPVFDRLHAKTVPLVRTGQHRVDGPPDEGGRWPISVVCLPDTSTAALLHRLTGHVGEVSGADHWQTRALGRAHFTVRALDGYRAVVLDDDPDVRRYRTALQRTARRTAPVRLHLTGLALAPGSVMACAEPADEQAFGLMRTLAEELGPDAWFEQPFGTRDIWYVNLLHFTGRIADPDRLVGWVGDRRDMDVGEVTLETVSLVRFDLVAAEPPGMRPIDLSTFRLTA